MTTATLAGADFLRFLRVHDGFGDLRELFIRLLLFVETLLEQFHRDRLGQMQMLGRPLRGEVRNR